MSDDDIQMFEDDAGQFVTVPRSALAWVMAVARATDSVVFWVGGGVNNGWQPLLLPRSLYRAGRTMVMANAA